MQFSDMCTFDSDFICSGEKILKPKRVDLSGVHTMEATLHPRDKDHPERPHLLTVAENVQCWEHMKPSIAKFSSLHTDDNMYENVRGDSLGTLRRMMAVCTSRRRSLSF